MHIPSTVARRALQAVLAGGIVALFAVHATAASAQQRTASEARCEQLVQGKVAWNRQGSRGWNAANLRVFCAGVGDYNARIRCFRNQISNGVDWRQAVPICKLHTAATFSPEAKCFDAFQGRIAWDRTNGNKKWHPANLRKLCAGVVHVDKRANCFRQMIRIGRGFQKAFRKCRTIGGPAPQRFTGDVGKLVHKISARHACTITTEVTGFKNYFHANGGGIGDHIQGIGMTTDRRIVATMSLTGSGLNKVLGTTNPGGILLVSSPYDFSRGKNNRLTWSMFKLAGQAKSAHPSNMQVAGNKVMVAQFPYPHIYQINTASNGAVTVSNLTAHNQNLRLNKKARRSRNNSDGTFSHYVEDTEAIGFTYDERTQRYYAFASDGKTSHDEGVENIYLHRTTQPGRDLANNSFEFFAQVNAVPVSAQGSSLLSDANGKFFVASTFAQGRLSVYALNLAFPGTVKVALPVIIGKNVGGTDGGLSNPKWRFAGGVTPIGSNEFAVLWSGRFNKVIAGALSRNDSYKIALQRITPRGSQKCR